MLGNYAPNQPPLSGVSTLAESLSQGPASSVQFHRGCNVEDRNASLIPAALAAARTPGLDAVVLVLGDSAASCGESIDRDSLDLPGGQLELLGTLVAAQIGAPLILVLINGRTATFGAGNSLLTGVSALLVGWRPGQEGGAALTNVLFGAVNPSGKLPQGWVRKASHVGSTASPWLQERSALGTPQGETGAEGRRYGSYWMERDSENNSWESSEGGLADPLFPFASGLSYTTFSLGNATVTVQRDSNTSFPIVAALTLENSGGVAGATSLLCYIQDPPGIGAGRVVRPWKRLIGFTKSPPLLPAQRLHLSLPIAWRDLAFYSENYTLALHPGNYTLSCGLGSTDDSATMLSFTL